MSKSVTDAGSSRLKIFKVAESKYAIFTEVGEYLVTLPYEEARPLILRPEARAEFLARHGVAESSQAAS